MSLRVALVHHAPAPPITQTVERAVAAAGHEAVRIVARPLPPVEAVLRLRGFALPLSHLPASALAIARGGFDVVHAFSVPDAAAAIAAGRLPVVFTPAEPLDRARVADARLRLRMLERVLRDAAAVTAADEAQRESLARWLLVDAPVIAPSDGEAHVRLYRELLP